MSDFKIAILEQIKALVDAVSRLDERMARCGAISEVQSKPDMMLEIRPRAEVVPQLGPVPKAYATPDKHFLIEAAKMQLEHIKECREWMAEESARTEEMCRVIATRSEIAALRA